jgi:DNA-binding PadR family transcriptional regulator
MLLVALDGLGRSAELDALILSSLAGGDKHGYALIKDFEGFTGLTLGPGTLHGALTRLEKRGLVQALAPSNDDAPTG